MMLIAQCALALIGSSLPEFQAQVEFELAYNKKLVESGAVKLE